jgi:DNA-binding NarL/FixJ family response regulator
MSNTELPASIRLLVVDDHTLMREGLKMLLEAAHDICVVGTAPNGCVALREVKRTKPDVVLMDIVMPEMNGIEAAAQILHSAPATAILMVSMFSDVEHVYNALRAGAPGYLLKTCASNQLISGVRAVHAGRRFLSQGIVESVVDEYLRGPCPSSPVSQLSRRELRVLQLLAEGRSTTSIARILSLSPKTIDTYRSRTMEKLGITERAALIKFAIRHGITPPE